MKRKFQGSAPLVLVPSRTRYRPAWWLPGPHLQTLGARVLRSHLRMRFVRERVGLPDGDFIDLDWAVIGRVDRGEPAPLFRQPTVPLVIVLHGLEGSARSTYALETYRRLAERGIASVGLNFRSCSGELNRAPRLYHSGETEDLRFVVSQLRRRFPDRSLGAIGFSLGGNVLLKHLGEEARQGQDGTPALVAATTVSVPFDLAAGADALEHGFGRLYVRRLLRSLKRKIRAKREQIGSLIDAERALASRTFREFDDAATAPLHGFTGADDYYRQSSSSQFLESIRTPARLIQAADDPFLPGAALPWRAVKANQNLDPLFTSHGGHVGFVTGQPWGWTFWAEGRAAEFMARHLMRAAGPSR